MAGCVLGGSKLCQKPGELADNLLKLLPGIMLPDDILSSYAHVFQGYGTWDAKVWFVGMEETGGWTESEVERRLAVWRQRGQRELEDAPSFYTAAGIREYHGHPTQDHPVWKGLIHMLMLARGEGESTDVLLNYQRAFLGSTHGDTCLADVLPLPVPNSRTWYYRDWSRLSWLQDHARYQANLTEQRLVGLRSRLDHYHPRVVIFYGDPGHSVWANIAGGEFRSAIEDKLLYREKNRTVFFVTRHPVSEKAPYFREVGMFMRAHYPAFFSAPQPVGGW